jgi:hypothetical protein
VGALEMGQLLHVWTLRGIKLKSMDAALFLRLHVMGWSLVQGCLDLCHGYNAGVCVAIGNHQHI